MTHLITAFKDFLKKEDLAAVSIKGYINDLLYFEKWLNPLGLLDVSFVDLQTFRDTLSQIKRQKPATLNRRIQAIKRFYRWCQNTRLMKDNPAKMLRFIPSAAPRKPLSLKSKDVHALLRAAGQSRHKSRHKLAKRNYALLQLLLQTGLRLHELMRLQMRDLLIYERSGTLRVIDGKGRKQRDIPLNSTARRALSSYLETRKSIQPEDFVFISKREEPMGIRAIQKMISSLSIKARVNVSAHILRHTFATHYLAANPSGLLELSTLLGHESCHTTAIYTKASSEKLAQSIESLDINTYGS